MPKIFHEIYRILRRGQCRNEPPVDFRSQEKTAKPIFFAYHPNRPTVRSGDTIFSSHKNLSIIPYGHCRLTKPRREIPIQIVRTARTIDEKVFFHAKRKNRYRSHKFEVRSRCFLSFATKNQFMSSLMNGLFWWNNFFVRN